MYLAGLVVVLGIWWGDFLLYTTMDEILDGQEDTIKWSNPELPFFCTAAPGGRSVTKEPMSSQGARVYFHKIAAAVGIDG
jgi:hypothetical protein